MDLNDSGQNLPIFNLMNSEENSFQNMILPPLVPPPFLSHRNYTNKKYSNETIDKMVLTLREFNKNINQMFETTNRMNLIIDKYNENYISIYLIYNQVQYFSIKCKKDDKILDAINKIKTGEDNFNINDKIIIFNGRSLDMNKTFNDEGIKNGNLLMINNK